MFTTKKSIIGIIKLAGIISTESRLGSRGGLNLNDLSDPITKAFSFKNVKAIVLLVNSPGGSPVQSALIANRIRDIAKEKEIPVYCFIEDLAASGGYWLSCAADKIYAMESSIIGSIGVITSGFGAVEGELRHQFATEPESTGRIGFDRTGVRQCINQCSAAPSHPRPGDALVSIRRGRGSFFSRF